MMMQITNKEFISFLNEIDFFLGTVNGSRH